MEGNFDIVKFIEKNPVTRLSSEYQNELILKIQEKFTKKEQQLFVGSYFAYLNYHPTKDFVVELGLIWKWIGFSRKDNAKALLKKHFIINIDYKIVFLQSQENLDEKNKGGRPDEQILLTVNTFKKFCLKANTKKADEIHDYYIKLENLLIETINEETDDLRNQLQIKDKQSNNLKKQLENKNEEIQSNKIQLQKKDKQIVKDKKNHKIEMKMNKHKTLKEFLKTKKCVYLGEIEEDELIKIGSSGDLNNRGESLKRHYGKYLFLEAFECTDYREVEKNILSHPDIVENLYKEKINGHKSKEVVKLSEDFNYEQLLAIVKKCVSESKMYDFTPEQLLEKQKLDFEKQKWDDKTRLESKKMDYDLILNISKNEKYENTIKENLEMLFNNIKNEKEQEKKIEDKIKENNLEGEQEEIEDIKDIDDSDEDMEINKRELKNIKNGKKIQKVDSNNLKKVLKVYNGMACVLRDPENNGYQKTSIQAAIKNNYLYKGFRWNYVENEEEYDICDLAPTVERQERKINTIVQLNSAKNKIIDTFSTKGDITKNLKIGMPKLNSIIEKNEKYNGNYYVELDKCSRDLLDKYNKPINQYLSKKSKKIKQINPKTNKIKIFNSMSDIYRQYGIADNTIANAIKNEKIYHGFLWEYAN